MLLSETLSLVAELAIALAGFASIVAVLGRGHGRDNVAMDAARVGGMLEYSLLAAAFALLPAVLFHAGLSENSTWRLCSALFGVSNIIYLTTVLRRLSRIRAYPLGRGHGFFNPSSASWLALGLALQIPAVALLFAAAAGWLARPEAAYLWALYVYLCMSALLFLRLVRSLLEDEQE